MLFNFIQTGFPVLGSEVAELTMEELKPNFFPILENLGLH